MSEQVCHTLGLIYDPFVQLNMQSANGSIDRFLGLVRNVSFQVGDIMLYLQMHVIRNPSYDILLGCPLDVVTESVVKNFRNEEQTITIICPNTSEVTTIPTMPRGHFKNLRNQEEVALVIEYECDTPKIVSYAAVNAADNSSVPALYLSVSNSVSSYLQSPYFSETSKVSEGPADHDRWLSGFLAAATPPEAPSLLHNNPNSLLMLSLSTFKDISSIPISGPRNATKVMRLARGPSLAPNPMVFLFKLSDSSPIPTFAASKKKYKPIALKTCPILGALDEQFQIIRKIKGDPLATMPTLSLTSPPFESTSRYTQEQHDLTDKLHSGDFLQPAERDLLHHFMTLHADALIGSVQLHALNSCIFGLPPLSQNVLPSFGSPNVVTRTESSIQSLGSALTQQTVVLYVSTHALAIQPSYTRRTMEFPMIEGLPDTPEALLKRSSPSRSRMHACRLT
ncbi:hypothetical protein AcV7_008905 [Taiwanofungus camphoratus]|nr:hypothetical protein AcV7_008905 [Antrodia cinnamomea]